MLETLRAAGSASASRMRATRRSNSCGWKKRYLYWSADISPDRPPRSGPRLCGVAQEGRFLGRDALLAQKEAGLRRRLELFRAGNAPFGLWRRGHDANGKVIGMTTSGDFGHSVGRSLVLGYVPHEYFGQNTMEIEAFGRRSLATRVEGCIYDPKNERVRA